VRVARRTWAASLPPPSPAPLTFGQSGVLPTARDEHPTPAEPFRPLTAIEERSRILELRDELESDTAALAEAMAASVREMVADIRRTIGRGRLSIERVNRLAVNPAITARLQRATEKALWQAFQNAKRRAREEVASAAASEPKPAFPSTSDQRR
jgi:hypothetical protein